MEITDSNMLQELRDEIQALRNDLVNDNTYISPRGTSNLVDIYTALAKAQSEMTIADNNKSNPFFKSRYADFQSVVQASRPALSKNGLAVYQEILINNNEKSVLHTVLAHSSGQYIESRMFINPPKNDIQTISSYITYLKRICYTSLVGVVTGEEDDDGEACMSRNNYNTPPKQPVALISKEQAEQLEEMLKDIPDIKQKVLDILKISSLHQMPKNKFNAIYSQINTIEKD